MSDPFSALQAPGVAVDDNSAGKVHPAYANYDDQGFPQVGFDVFMELPKTCLKCAAPADTKRVADVRVKRDVLTHLLHRGDLSQNDDRVVAGKYKLDLPHCQSCCDAYARSRKRYLISLFYPFMALALIIIGALLYSTAALILLLVSVVAVPVAQRMAKKAYDSRGVAIAALDTDGFIVLTHVDAEAGQAIVEASGAA